LLRFDDQGVGILKGGFERGDATTIRHCALIRHCSR
jgi:hypothetical protein